MLARISCRQFRNLETSNWQPEGGCHLILGANGAGKTSLLEAVYLLATTRSFRTAQLFDCVRHESSGFHLEGEVHDDRRTLMTFGAGAAEGRYRSVNGNATSLVDHLRVLPVVAWTAEDKETLAGAPERRRRFLDQGIVGSRPGALEVLARFRRTLYQKRQLLLGDPGGLGSWNELLAVSASELMVLRHQYVERLSVALREVATSIELDLAEVTLEYRPSIEGDPDDPMRVLEQLEKVKRDEIRDRRPLIGPHRDELMIRLGGHSLRRVGSAGESKIIGLLLTAARGRVLEAAERAPLYLLDDADSELDEQRLSAIWRVFEPVQQVFVTSSRPEVWRIAPEAIRWHLEAGSARRGNNPPKRL